MERSMWLLMDRNGCMRVDGPEHKTEWVKDMDWSMIGRCERGEERFGAVGCSFADRTDEPKSELYLR